jgi:hypothetical protein
VRKHEGNGLGGLDDEFADRCEVFCAQCGRGAQDQTLRTGNRTECAVVQPADPRHRRPIVEPRHELGAKNHPPRPPGHDPHKIPALCRKHEIDHCRTAGVGFEVGFEDEGAGTIRAAHAAGRVLRGNEPSAVVWCPEQGGKAGSRIETRPAEPVDRAVAADQGCRSAVADQRIVFDSQRHRSLP